jgi:hypothetical protein
MDRNAGSDRGIDVIDRLIEAATAVEEIIAARPSNRSLRPDELSLPRMTSSNCEPTTELTPPRMVSIPTEARSSVV